jgi:hypothetical protein
MSASMPGWPEPKPPCASFTTFVGDERACLQTLVKATAKAG